jgi:hypothetical protein
MDKEQVYSVNIYFVNPLEIISVVSNTLIELEYETYTVSDLDKFKLLKVVQNDIRSVIFICVRNKIEIEESLRYIEEILSIKGPNILIGAFVYDHMDTDVKNKFLINNVSTIELSQIKKDPVSVLKNILTYFEARGKRLFIRTKTYGTCEAYFYFKNREAPILGKITDISAYAFSCELDEMNKLYFEVGAYLPEILYVLGGVRIRTAAKVLGFNKDKNNEYILKYCTAKMTSDKLIYEEKIAGEIKQKLHDYIRKCLKDSLTQKFNAIDDKDAKEPKIVKHEKPLETPQETNAEVPVDAVDAVEVIEDEKVEGTKESE